jgi:hypothetical protein
MIQTTQYLGQESSNNTLVPSMLGHRIEASPAVKSNINRPNVEVKKIPLNHSSRRNFDYMQANTLGSNQASLNHPSYLNHSTDPGLTQQSLLDASQYTDPQSNRIHNFQIGLPTTQPVRQSHF